MSRVSRRKPRRSFVLISIAQYIPHHIKSNPGEPRAVPGAALQESLKAAEYEVCCDCGEPIWVVLGSTTGRGYFTCITGQSKSDQTTRSSLSVSVLPRLCKRCPFSIAYASGELPSLKLGQHAPRAWPSSRQDHGKRSSPIRRRPAALHRIRVIPIRQDASRRTLTIRRPAGVVGAFPDGHSH
jgi:hypothetical protein